METNNEKPLAEDLLSGAAAIAEDRGEPLHRTYRLLEAGEIPGFKVGSKWYSTRSAQRADIARRLRQAVKA